MSDWGDVIADSLSCEGRVGPTELCVWICFFIVVFTPHVVDGCLKGQSENDRGFLLAPDRENSCRGVNPGFKWLSKRSLVIVVHKIKVYKQAKKKMVLDPNSNGWIWLNVETSGIYLWFLVEYGGRTKDLNGNRGIWLNLAEYGILVS